MYSTEIILFGVSNRHNLLRGIWRTNRFKTYRNRMTRSMKPITRLLFVKASFIRDDFENLFLQFQLIPDMLKILNTVLLFYSGM